MVSRTTYHIAYSPAEVVVERRGTPDDCEWHVFYNGRDSGWFFRVARGRYLFFGGRQGVDEPRHSTIKKAASYLVGETLV